MRSEDGLVFGVLGPLEVYRDGAPLDISAAKQRTLLACLLLRANQVVTIQELVGALWDGPAPTDARGTVQKYVMRLRRALGDGAPVHTEADGYRIAVEPGRLDLDRFRELVGAARAAADRGDPAEESALLRAALSLWRGLPPLSDVSSAALHADGAATLVEQRLQVLERRIELDLRAGRFDRVADELRMLVAEHPYREHLWARRIRALAGAGRRDDALAAYQEITAALADELGVDAGHELRAAHREVLARAGPVESTTQGVDTGGAPPAAAAGGEPAGSTTTAAVVARQLPTLTRGFAGRRAEIDTITAALTPEPARRSTPMVVIAGAAGTGKTTLAVHAAHQVSGHFPDGQLFADLRGHSADEPIGPEQLLGQFLRSLGSPPEAVPLRLDEQIAAYRALLAGRRTLVVLDNAGGEDQVRALLPGTPGCAVIVTSRYELAGLNSDPDVDRVRLGTLSTVEAWNLLGQALDADRLTGSEAATTQLIDCCGHLPLALRLAAAHLRLRPELRVGDYVAQLRSRGALRTLRVDGDDQANLAAAFTRSYRQLLPAHQRALRLLSLVPGPDFTTDTAALLTGHASPAAAAALDQLSAAHLVERRGTDRFRLHDLVREYAANRCRAEETRADRDLARGRLFGFYLAGAYAATDAHPVTRGLGRLDRPDLPDLPQPPDPGWTDRELSVLVAAARYCAEHGPHHFAYHLADALRGHFMLRASTTDWLAVTEAGLRAARRDGAEYAAAAMLHDRGNLSIFTGDLGGSMGYLREALEIYARHGSAEADAVRISLGNAAGSVGRLDVAIPHLDTALTNYLRVGDHRWTMMARQYLLLALLVDGDLERAGLERDRLVEGGHHRGSHVAVSATGMYLRLAGDLREAATVLRSGVDLARRNGDRRMGLGLLTELATCYLELGRDLEAYDSASTALGSDLAPRFSSKAECVLAQALARMGRTEEARRRFASAWRTALRTANPEQVCAAVTGLAELELAAGQPARARGHAARAASVAAGSGLRIRRVHALVTLAGCHHRLGSPDHARHAAEQALAISDGCGYPLGRAMALAELGTAALARGDEETAAARRADADRIYTAIGSYRAAPPDPAPPPP